MHTPAFVVLAVVLPVAIVFGLRSSQRGLSDPGPEPQNLNNLPSQSQPQPASSALPPPVLSDSKVAPINATRQSNDTAPSDDTGYPRNSYARSSDGNLIDGEFFVGVNMVGWVYA